MAAGDPADPIGALITFLKDDTRISTLTAGRVFGGELPDAENKLMPRQTILLRDAGGPQALRGGYLPAGDQRVDVLSYAATLHDARNLYGAVLLSLNALKQQVIDGTRIHWCRPAGGPNTMRDPDEEWPLSLSTWQILASDLQVA